MNTIHIGDARAVLQTMPASSVNCVVTSPPYFGLREYENAEQTPACYIEHLVEVFDEVARVLRPDGTLWLNIGDSFGNDRKWGGASGGKQIRALHGQTKVGREKRCSGVPPKSLIGIPWRLAFALMDRGWAIRSEIVWHKPNPMPDPVKDRPTCSHDLFSRKGVFDDA